MQNAGFGIGIKILKDLTFETNVNLGYNNSSGISGAFKYTILNILDARLSLLSNPLLYEAGIRLNALSFLCLNWDLEYMELLGYSRNYGLSLYW